MTVSAPAFVPPMSYGEFLAFDPNYITKFLRSRRCPAIHMEDFSQSLHAHLMSIGPTGAARGHADKLSEYAPELRGGATTQGAWADWLNMLLSREYGKLIKRVNRGGIRGENVVSLSSEPLEQIGVLDQHDRERMLDRGHQTITSRVFVSQFMDYLKEEEGELLVRFAQNLMLYDNLIEVSKAMGIAHTKAVSLRNKMRECGARFKRGC